MWRDRARSRLQAKTVGLAEFDRLNARPSWPRETRLVEAARPHRLLRVPTINVGERARAKCERLDERAIDVAREASHRLQIGRTI